MKVELMNIVTFTSIIRYIIQKKVTSLVSYPTLHLE